MWDKLKGTSKICSIFYLLRFLDMHMYVTSALQRTDMKAVSLQLALDILHRYDYSLSPSVCVCECICVCHSIYM